MFSINHIYVLIPDTRIVPFSFVKLTFKPLETGDCCVNSYTITFFHDPLTTTCKETFLQD